MASKQQIATWKKQHGDIFEITSGDKTAYIRKPNRTELSYAMTMAQTNPLALGEEILRQCWLDGDKEIQDDDSHFLGVAQQIEQIITIVDSEIKKL